MTIAAPSANMVESTLTGTYTRGTDTVLAVTDGSIFPSPTPLKHVIMIRDTYSFTATTKWCLVKYVSRAANDLTMSAAADYALAVNLGGGAVAAEVFPIGSYVSLVNAADEIAHLFTEQADKIDADGSVPLTADWDVLDNKITAQNLAADALTAARVVFTGTDGLLSVDSALVWDNTNKRLGIGVTPTVSLDIAGGTIRVVSNGDKFLFYENDVAEADAFIKLSNATSTGNVLQPLFTMKSNFEGNFYANAMMFDTNTDEVGEGPVVSFMARSSNVAVVNRDLFWFDNYYDNPAMVIKATGRIAIGLKAPLAQLHVDQASTSGAIPVLTLDQADLSEGFINLIGTSAASAVGPISTWTGGAAIEGYYRIEINGAQKWVPFCGDPTA